MAAKGEEIILDPDLGHAQKLGPEAGQGPLDRRARGDIGGFKLGPGKARAIGLGAGFQSHALPHQRLQIKRGHQHLRRVNRQRPQEGLGPLGGADATGKRLRQPLLGR